MAVIADDTYADRVRLGTLSGRVDSTPVWSTHTGSPDGVEETNAVNKSANYTATRFDDVIIMDATGGARTVTLPTAVGATGVQYTVKKANSNANNVTIAPSGGQTIDSSSNYVITVQYASVTVVSDGANWVIV